MCQIIHVEDLREETRERLEEQTGDDIVTLLDAAQCEENWERGVREFVDFSDLQRLGRQRTGRQRLGRRFAAFELT